MLGGFNNCCGGGGSLLVPGGGGGTAAPDYTAILEAIRDNPKGFDVNQFEDPSTGQVIVAKYVKNPDGTVTTTFENQDGTAYAGDPNTLIPYNRDLEVLEQTSWCVDGTTYKVFNVLDGDLGTIVKTVFINQDDNSLSVTAPTGSSISKSGACSTANNTELDLVVSERTVCGLDQLTGFKNTYIIRTEVYVNNTTGAKTSKDWFSMNGLVFTDVVPVDMNGNPVMFTPGACPIEVVYPCYENRSYEIPANKAIVFNENTLFSYGGSIYKGEGKVNEFNDIDAALTHTEGDAFSNGDANLIAIDKPLPNKLVVSALTNSNVKMSVLQICGYTPEIVDIVNGLIVLSATPNTTTNEIDLSWNDISGETGYEVWRYESINGVSTAVLVQTLPADTTAWSDNTVVPNTNYTYFIKGVNPVSSATSNQAVGELAVISGSIVLAWTGSGYDSNEDFALETQYIP
jgi:hypothetical protein